MITPWTERELRRQIVQTCTALWQKNLVAATDGNVSARLGPDRVLITPSGVSKGQVTELSVMLCDMDGRKIRGRGEISSEVHVHLACYRAREDICAVVHAHPQTASAFTFAGRQELLLDPVVPEVYAQIGPIPSAPYITPGSRALAESVGPLVKKSDVVMMSQHGAVAVGKDPWAAYLRMEKLEHFAGILKSAAELAGDAHAVRKLNELQIQDLLASYGKKYERVKGRTGEGENLQDAETRGRGDAEIRGTGVSPVSSSGLRYGTTKEEESFEMQRKKDSQELSEAETSALVELIAQQVLQKLGRAG